MSPLFGTVDELEPGKSRVALQLRLIRHYDVPEMKNNKEVYSHECIFHDKMGTRIHASIQRATIVKFKSILQEGKVYGVKDFIVTHNTMKYKTTTNKYKMLIFKQTHLCDMSDDKFPLQMYNLKSIEDVIAMEDAYDSPLIDVMGMIVSRSTLETKNFNGKHTNLMDITLEDLEGRIIICTLWEKYAEEFTEFLANEDPGPVASIIQFCRPSIYRGEIRLSTVYHATKLILDKNDVDLLEFSNSYMAKGKVASQTVMVHTQSRQSKHDEESIVKTITQLQTDAQAGLFWVYATIFGVETIGPWAYMACKKCLKKLQPDGNKYYCVNCNYSEVGGKLRYRLTVRVIDDNGTASFLLWDRECLSLIGKPAYELDKTGNLENLPEEIETLAGQKALFKVQVKEGQIIDFTGSYNVADVTKNLDMLSKYCDKKGNQGKSGRTTNKRKTGKNCDESSNFEACIPTRLNKMKEADVKNMKEDPAREKKLMDEFSVYQPKKKWKKTVKKEK